MSSEREERVRRAEQAVRQGRVDAAIAEFGALVNEQPTDLAAANALGDLLVRAGRTPEALPFYRHVGDSHLREGFFSKAAGFYRKVLKFTPEDEGTALRLVEALIQQGLVVEAKGQLQAVAQARRRRGDTAGADEALLRIADLGPGALGDLVDEMVAAGAVAEARGLLSPDLLQAHPALRARAAELALRHGDLDEARQVLAAWLGAEPEALPAVLALCAGLDDLDLGRRYLATELAVDAAVACRDFALAARHVREHLASHPHSLPALLRLVDVCVDGDLDLLITDAQLDLADAFVAHGRAGEARLVLEDVLLQEPDHAGCRERLVAVLAGLGEPDPEAAVGRLLALEDEREDGEDDPDADVQEQPGAPVARPPHGGVAGPLVEVDLTVALNALAVQGAPGSPGETAEGPASLPDRPATLEAVFDRLREEASPRRGTEGRQFVALGHTYLAAGMVEAAIETFRRAAQDAEARAAAAVALSETYDELEDPAQALEWLEHGADAQESPEAERLEAMRRLAGALERGGEPERALAVWLEIATVRPQDPQAAGSVARLTGDQRRS